MVVRSSNKCSVISKFDILDVIPVRKGSPFKFVWILKSLEYGIGSDVCVGGITLGIEECASWVYGVNYRQVLAWGVCLLG